jgi:hypothetical protein
MRKIGIGTAGDVITGSQLLLDNTITTLLANEDLNINPNGSGEVKVTGNAQINSAGLLKFGDADNSNWVAIKGPATTGSDLTLVLPNSYGTNGQVLQGDGSGNLSWGSPGINITNDVSTANNNNYLMFSSTTSGTTSSLSTSNNKLFYQPSTGNLFTQILTGGEGNGNNLVLRSTSGGTKGQVYVDENTASRSTTTGALRVAGGVGIAGNCYIGGTMQAQTVTETSSITLKENISPIENALEKVIQLAGVVYDRKDGSSKNEAGLIAEDTNKVLPNIVTKDEQGNPEGINYTKISAYLVEAIKTIKEDLDDLKTKLR